MTTATAVAPSNIAFVKYWGVADAHLTLPYNESISMNLDSCSTTTTVRFDQSLNDDEVLITWYGQSEQAVTGSPRDRVVAHLDRIRARSGVEARARVTSANNFPAAAGIASSASAFAALTLAGATAAGLRLDERELSILARQSGSGSACRSIPDGFVHWQHDGTDEGSYAVSVARPEHWDLVDIVAVVSAEVKRVGSAENHRLVSTSPYFGVRLQEVPGRVAHTLLAIRARNLGELGAICEADAISLHVVAMTAIPATFYWNAGTMAVVHAIHAWRNEGLFAYFTMDAGANVHVLCSAKDRSEVDGRLQALPEVQWTIANGPANGARLLKHDGRPTSKD
jgi:diphosphomevalonate decarboxylase